MNRVSKLLLILIILIIGALDLYVSYKIGFNEYSGKIIALSFVMITLVSNFMFEEKTFEDKIFTYIVTVVSVILLIRYLPILFAITISVSLVLLTVYSSIRSHRLMAIIVLSLMVAYMLLFITKVVVVSSTTGYAIVRQTIFPATITSIAGNTITFSQTSKAISGQNKLYPMTTDCVYNINNGLDYCFELTGEVNYGSSIGYYIKGRIGNKTCFILLFSNNTFKSNCPYVRRVVFNKIENYVIRRTKEVNLNYSITFNITGFKRLIDYVLKPLSCNLINASTKEMSGMMIHLSTKGTTYKISRFEIYANGRKIYSESVTPSYEVNKIIREKLLIPATSSYRFMCVKIWLVNNKKTKTLELCSPIPFACLNIKYLSYVLKTLHHYYTPYNIEAIVNITKVEAPYIYIGVRFNKTDFGRKVGLVIYNDNTSSPTLEIKLVGECKGNYCYEVVKEPLPSIKKENNVTVELIAGPNSKVVSKARTKFKESKNVSNYSASYSNVAKPLSEKMNDIDLVNKGYKIVLGVSILFMLLLIFML